ncbi:MAG: nitroreductase family protein [Anaerolineae bacterium]
MSISIRIQAETCTACGLCGQVCPNLIMYNAGDSQMALRPDRLPLCIQCGHCMAVCPTRSIVVDGLSYERDFFPLPNGPVASLPFAQMITTRRAVRNFKDQPVSRELLERVVEAISFAPPSFPPIKTGLVVVQDSAVIRRALPEMIELYDRLVRTMHHPVARLFVRRKVGRATFRTLKHHVVPLMASRLPELKEGSEDTITRHAPAMLLFHAHRDADNYEADAHIALTYGLLAAHALGLGACAIDLIPPAVEQSPTLRTLFSIPDSNAVVACMVLGYPRLQYQCGIKRQLKGVTWI